MRSRRTGRPLLRAAAWLAALGPLFYLSYGFANWWASTRAHVPSVVFGWEHDIPFVPWTIFVYWSINVFYTVSFFLAKDRFSLDRHGARLLTVQIVAIACFVAWPLRFSFGQPAVTGPSAFLFDALRGFDRPFNQAPSLHIALAVILWDWYRRLLRPGWPQGVLHVWTWLICSSVLTTWQHHFIDIPTGALLGCLCVWLWPIERVVALPRAWRTAEDPLRWKIGALYAAGSALCFSLALAGGGVALWLCWPAASLAIVALNYIGFGARGFQMNRHARMSWPARWLLAPYRLGASINARLWTRRLDASVEVVPGIRLGRLPTQPEWLAAGRPHVVSLCAELQAKIPGARCVPMLDLVVPSPRSLRRAIGSVRAAQHARANDGPGAGPHDGIGPGLWIACAIGFSRSAAVVVGWLRHADTSAMTAPAAHAAVLRARPQTVLRPAWHAALDQAVGSSGTSHV